MALGDNNLRSRVSQRYNICGPDARGYVNCEETDPSDVTDLYHGLHSSDNASMS